MSCPVLARWTVLLLYRERERERREGGREGGRERERERREGGREGGRERERERESDTSQLQKLVSLHDFASSSVVNNNGMMYCTLLPAMFAVALRKHYALIGLLTYSI